MIDTVIPDIPTPPSSRDRANFRLRADVFLASLDDLAEKLNSFGSEANSLAVDVNLLNEETLANKNLSYSHMVRAETAAKKAESIVVPTNATYSVESIEIALNALLTQLVAQQAQISILKGD